MTTKRSTSLAGFLLSAFATTSLFMTVPAGAQQRQALPTQLSAPAGARAVGRLPGSGRLSLALTLRLRNQQELQSLLRELYDPASPNYRQFLTVQQFTEQFGPTIDDYENVTGFAESHGLTVTHTAPNRLVLDVSGTVADIERAFQVTMQVYQHPTEPRTYYAPNEEPSVDPSVPVQGVSGLNNFSPPHPISLRRVQVGETDTSNFTGSGPGGFFLGSDIRAAYMPGVTLDGTGQAVGLFGAPYNLSDVQAYFSTIDQPLNVPIVNVLLDGVSGICGACDDTEPAIDIEQAISMAPNLSAVIVYESNLQVAGGDVDILNRMATDNIAKQLSTSFGWLPADPSSDEPIFKEFAVQGQNLFVASGDSGAYNAPSCSDNGYCSWYPADDPYITAVGGTDLTTSGPGGTWQSETTWVHSAGGFSTNGISIPSYQVPVINSLNQGSTTLRNIPDVAAEANPDNYYCANGGCPHNYVIGGTSVAAPRWAGFLALASQQANGTPIGFLNPTIYGIGQGPEYGNDFHDITEGNNFNSGSPDLFSAVTGYDLVTGWGTPNGQSLLTALSGVPTGPNFALAPSPRSLTVTRGNGGTSTITVSAVNGFSGTVNFTVTALGQPAGVTASLNPTSVAGSGASTLTVSTTSSTPVANFPIVVTGTSGTLTQTAYVTLTVSLSGTAPVVSLSAPGLSFGSQPVSTTSPARAETVTNTGTANLSISTATIGGANASDFAKSADTCTGATVIPNGTCTVSVRFTPSATGSRSASLSFTDNASGSPQTAALSGSGVASPPTLSPTSLSFAAQPVSTTSTAQAVTLSNPGSVALSITSIALAGTNAGDYGQSNTCGSSVAAGANCAINVTFTPSASGTRTASLTITDNALNSPQILSLSGTGRAASLSATSLSFGAQPVGSSSLKTVTLTNLGSTPLTISSLSVVSFAPLTALGTKAEDFAIESSSCTAGGSIAGLASCTITVAFKPTAAGVRSATLVIRDSDPGSPQTVSLRGTGTAVRLSATSLGFGPQRVDTTSAPKTVTLANLGSTPLGIASLTLRGTDAGDFAIQSSSTCVAGSSVAGGGSCTINLAFKPSAAGARSATLVISDSDPSSPQTVGLSGTGR
ncbi:MAG: choice-of-anchor D domain-containing protein [Terriglobia bacterium]